MDDKSVPRSSRQKKASSSQFCFQTKERTDFVREKCIRSKLNFQGCNKQLFRRDLLPREKKPFAKIWFFAILDFFPFRLFSFLYQGVKIRKD